ncbi:MAG: methionyl-tRNA formyltransferase [Clostridiales bacterium]|nr:methionyl-tRNA formyltransferase [Clostridiales bacterium]
MKIVYMGTPDFAVPPLRALAEEGFWVAAVVTQPDKPKGRGKTLKATPVKEAAQALGIPVFQPARVRDSEFMEEMCRIRPDLIVVAAFGQILPEELINLPAFGCVNIHASLLPKYRGAAPIQHAVLNGEKESGVTLMRMGTGLDTGDMIAKEAVSLAPDETGGTLFDRLSAAGAELLIRTLPSVFDGTAVYERQPKESPTPYAAMITREDGRMDFSRDAAELERLVRGMNPWPGAFAYPGKKMLKIWKSRVESRDIEDATEPGTVVRTGKDGIYVLCGDGNCLVLEEVQLEGKKRMGADAFLRGCALETGTVLCGRPCS